MGQSLGWAIGMKRVRDKRGRIKMKRLNFLFAGCRVRIGLISLVLLTLASSIVAGENWSRFRGPGGLGLAADDPDLPEAWAPDKNVAWKTPIPGLGWSSPIVWDGKIFLTTAVPDGASEGPKKGLYLDGERPEPPKITHHWWVYCLKLADGSVLWKQEVHSGVPPKGRHIKNTFASETPVADAERVYAYFGNIGVFALSHSGDLLWECKLPAYDTTHGWGTASSPALYKDRLFIVHDNDEHSYMVSIEAKTGKILWKLDRPDASTTYSTPFIWENNLRAELITNGGDSPPNAASLGYQLTKGIIRSYDLDGKLLWQLHGGTQPVVASPFALDGLLYITSGWVAYPYRPCFAIRPGASGDITLEKGKTSNDYIQWFSDKIGPYHPTPIIVGGLYYTLFDQGFLTCTDAKTGKEIFGRQRIEGSTANFTVSPWSYNGKIFCLNEDGDTFIVKAGPAFELLGKNSLGEMCMATPAIAGKTLIIRGATNLYAIRKGAATVASSAR